MQDCVTLRKMGLGKWTIGCQNTSTGDFEVVEGTVALAAAESLPVGDKSTLRVADGATLEVLSGVAAEIPYAEIVAADGTARPLRAGTYGGPACAVAGATRADWMSGAGTLRVKRGYGGTLMIIR